MGAGVIPKLRPLVWLLLALPALAMLYQLATGETFAFKLLHPTGEMALRLMVVALMVGPLIAIFGRNRFLLGWLALRRNIGVAAFIYGLMHLVFYVMDMAAIGPILDEFWLPGIWTGWLSFALMLAAAAISADWAVKALGPWWQRVQYAVYGAVLIGALHWYSLDNNAGPALVHLAPLVLLWTPRAVVKRTRRNRKKAKEKAKGKESLA